MNDRNSMGTAHPTGCASVKTSAVVMSKESDVWVLIIEKDCVSYCLL